MKCTQIRKYLIPYSEGTLAEDLARRVEEHVSKCESCAREANELRQTVDVLRHTEYPQMEPAYDLRSRVMAQIAREPEKKKSWWSARMPAYSAAAAALLVFAVVIVSVEKAFVPMSREAARAPSVMMKKAPDTQSVKSIPAPEKAQTHEDSRWALKQAPVKPEIAAPKPPAPSSDKPATKRMYAGRPAQPERKERAAEKSADFSLNDSRELGDRVLAKSASEVESYDYSAGAIPGPAGPAGPPAAGGVPTQAAPAPALTAQAPYGGSQQYPQERVSDNALGMGNASPGYAMKSKPSADASAADKVARLESNLKEYPTSRSTLEDLTYAYRDAGLPEDEYATATKLTKMYPDNAQYWFQRAQAAERAKMSHTAMSCYRRAIELKLSGPNLETAKTRLKALEEAASHK